MGKIADLIRAAEFPDQTFRGYDHEAVDSFLESVAALDLAADDAPPVPSGAWYTKTTSTDPAGTGTTGAPTPETVSTTGPAPSPVPDVSSMLTIAQRTVDATLSEARAEADRTVTEAKTTAERIVADARYDARTEGEAIRAAAAENLDTLTRSRDEMANELEALSRHVAAERSRIADSLARLAVVVSDPAALTVAPRAVPDRPAAPVVEAPVEPSGATASAEAPSPPPVP